MSDSLRSYRILLRLRKSGGVDVIVYELVNAMQVRGSRAEVEGSRRCNRRS